MQYSMKFMPDESGDKNNIVYAAVNAEVTDDDINIYLGDDVDLGRMVEYSDGWTWLVNGVRERNLLDDQFKGSALYSQAPINRLTTPGRTTSSDFADITVDSVGIGIGVNVSTAGMTAMLTAAFQQLRDHALERITFDTAV
jgi:hypothetical protein